MTYRYKITKAMHRNRLIKKCIDCKKISLDGETWIEYKNSTYKNYTHGLCEKCFKRAMFEIRSMKKYKLK